MGSRGRYRPHSLTHDESEQLLLTLGEAHHAAIRLGRSIHFNDPRTALANDLKNAINAVAKDLTGDDRFYADAGSTSTNGYMKLLAKRKNEAKD
jgi:hypothetical protein